MAEEIEPVKASELIEKIAAGGIVADVVDDEDCYPKIFSASIEADEDGVCSVTAYYGYQEDQPTHGVSPGAVVFEVCGVKFSADRDFDGGHGDFSTDGREIEYDGDLEWEDVVNAIEEHVDITGYYPDGYEFDESEVTDDDIIDAIDEGPEVFAEGEDGIRGFESEDDVPEGYEIIDSDEAIASLVADRDNVEFESWG